MEKLNTWMQTQYVALTDTLRREEGQDFGEYVFLFAMIVILVGLGLGPFKDAVIAAFGSMATALANAF
jgi:hypothetical protein